MKEIKKIGKLERLGEGDFQIGEILLLDRCVEIVDKINELVEAYNQSPKQPEGKIGVKEANSMIRKIEKAYGVDTGLKGDEELHEHLKKNGLSSLSKLLKPEKQPEVTGDFPTSQTGDFPQEKLLPKSQKRQKNIRL